MNLPLDGYKAIRLLRESPSARVYAAIREFDQREVVAKVYDLVDDEGLEARVEHEFRLIQDLEVEGVVRALALERAGTKLVVVLEWCPGVNLGEFCNGKALDVGLFLDFAIQLARILSDVHGQRVIHRDIKPTNILVEPETHRISLADFGISVLLANERERINDQAVLEGTLPYISPEQSGRMGREVDFRSDLYSLGATFYEMLTGRRPFHGRSPLELIHAHLARRPERPDRLRPELPAPLSAIVMKLLEKAPERRYQSARGLSLDLQRLQIALDEGQGVENFPLGVDDVSMTLQLPHRLYGRSVEIELLIREYKRAGEGDPRFVLVTGPAGIGKSALITQLSEPVIGRQGFLARGKFDREQRDKPFGGFVLAFDDLIDQLLTESDAQLGFWRRELHQALGPLLPAACELTPRLRAIVGPTPSLPDVGPAEAHHRTALACARLVSVFARAEHPLALALDDIHWADRASCELIGQLLAEPQAALLVLASMRMDELPGGHPIREVIDEVEGERDQMLWLDLGPLGRREVAALVGDALSRAPDEVASLAQLIGRKANHNPFFIRQFMTHLVDLRLLRASPAGWVWDENAIELAGIPDDLLGMMTEKLERLESGPREVLLAAAVIGTRFDLATLELTAGHEHLGRGLVRLVEEGLLTSIGTNRYAFTHDRIRDVAYRMVPLERRCALHRQIGEHRLERAELDELSDTVFELVDHIDHGHGLIALVDELPEAAASRAAAALVQLDTTALERLAQLNALAGYKALNGASARSAAGYFHAGVALGDQIGPFPAPGDPGHDLRLALHLGLCQALALAGEREQADARFAKLLAQPLDPGDFGRVVVKQINSQILANDRFSAVEHGLAGLRELGVSLDPNPGEAVLTELLPRLQVDELRALSARPRASDAHVCAAMDILVPLSSAAQFVDPDLHAKLAATHVALVVGHGLHASAPLALSQIALLLGVRLGHRDLALELIELASELASREGPECMRHRIAVPRWIISSWRRPYTEALEPMRESAAQALEAGDLEYAGLATALQIATSLAAGTHLRAFERAAEIAVHRLRQWGASTLLPGVLAHLDFARLLASGDEELISLPDPLGLDSLSDDAQLRATRLEVELLHLRLMLMFGRERDAWTRLRGHRLEAERSLGSAWHLGGLVEIEGLIAAALLPSASAEERSELLEVLERSHRRLRDNADQGTVAFEAGAELLAAELAFVGGELERAFILSSAARRAAANQRELLLEALALERMATHARARGLPELSLGPLREARDRYHYWGAFTKVTELERRFPELREDRSVRDLRRTREQSGELNSEATSDRNYDPNKDPNKDPTRDRINDQTQTTTHISGSGGTSGRTLDMATVLKTAQAISADIRLDEVIERVMALALENAGADRGALLLHRDERTGLVALSEPGSTLQSFLRNPVPLEAAGMRVPISLLHFVERTRETALFDDISTDLRFASDPYIDHQRVRSALCVPILKQSQYVGLLYLENKLSPGAFTGARLEVLELLIGQAASALENAQLYEKLRASEVRWRSLVEGLPDVVLLVDRDGHIEFINHVDPHSGQRFIGALAGEFVSSVHLPALRRAVAEVVSEAERRELELVGTFQGDEPRWYTTRLAPIVVDGRVERIIAVGTDITERREAEAKQAMLEATLRQQQRLESIGTLASGVAHEINNPVQGIMNYAELIATSEDLSDINREFAEEIGHESQRVAAIVRNLLAFSRQEGDRAAAPARLADIVNGTLSLVRTVLRKDQIRLRIDIPDDLPPVDCQVQQIQQVVMNLVTNARDAVRGRYPEFDERKHIELLGETFERDGGTWVRLSVTDHGGGVPEEVVARIFDPFFTTKGRDQGTGLGLAVSHGIIKEHGGELRLENHPGESAVFHIELPC